MRNTSYIFIPFRFEKHSAFSQLISSLDGDSKWEQVHVDITYMLKYVADKINSRDRQNCQCFHYELSDGARELCGLKSADEWYSTAKHPFYGKDTAFKFQIKQVHLYCFSTTVCTLAFRLHFKESDPIWLSSALYNIKKVSREPINDTTLLDISKTLMMGQEAFGLDYFFYANPSTERANVLTYLEVEPSEDYRREMYYLRRCYSDGFIYSESPELYEQETYTPSKDINWGISPEAAVCLTIPGNGRDDFVTKTFYKHFNEQYLFMYILLLHQKYVLYMLLTKIGVGTYNDLDMLEEYRHQLYEFETDFVFSCVTEVPQYQNLYERMSNSFALKQMYADVHEPIVSLSEVRRHAAESHQRSRDLNVNKALFTLSLLTFFSALIDSYDFIGSFFGWFVDSTAVKIMQVVCIVFVVAAIIYVFRNLFLFKDKK